MAELFTPRRELGRTGFIATRIGAGDLADRQIARDELVRILRRAFDSGINLVDTAPLYEKGFSEEIVSEAVKGCRDRLFVIDKVDELHSSVAPQVEESLARLQLDHTDAFVFHGVSDLKDWERLAAPGGGMAQLAALIGQGKTRFMGISGHSPTVMVQALKSGLCDLVMFPVGPYVDERFLTEVLPLAKDLRIGTECFKTFGAGKLLGDTSGYNQPLSIRPRGKLSSGGKDDGKPVLPCLSVQECLDLTLTMDPDVALLGMSFPNEQDAVFDAFRGFHELSSQEIFKIRQKAEKAVKDKGPCWWYID